MVKISTGTPQSHKQTSKDFLCYKRTILGLWKLRLHLEERHSELIKKKKVKFSENALIGDLYMSNCEISKDVK